MHRDKLVATQVGGTLDVALTIALLSMHLTSGEVIFDHVYEEIVNAAATGMISIPPCHV